MYLVQNQFQLMCGWALMVAFLNIPLSMSELFTTIHLQYSYRTKIPRNIYNYTIIHVLNVKKKTTASNVPIVAIDVTSLSLTGNRDWVLCIEYEVFI